MELSVKFEDTMEFTKLINPSLVIQTCKQSFDVFTLTTKIMLTKHGIDKDTYNTKYVPLVKKASKWYWKNGIPENACMTISELLLWKELMCICSLIIEHENSMRGKHMKKTC